MGTYIYSVICAAVSVSLICALAPQDDSVSKFVAFAGALAVTLTILHPFGTGSLPDISDIIDMQTEVSVNGEAASAEYYARSAAMTLSAMTGADTDKISARVIFDDSGEVKETQLSVDGILPQDKVEIANKLSEIFGYAVVIYDTGG